MLDDSDPVLPSWNVDDDAQSVQSSSCSSDCLMQTSLAMDTSPPPSPPFFPTHYDEPMPSHQSPINIDEDSNGLVSTLIMRLSELVIESHLEVEATEDVDDDTVTLDSTDAMSDDDLDEDQWMDDFYDMDLDEELHETYQMGKYLGLYCLVHSFITHILH